MLQALQASVGMLCATSSPRLVVLSAESVVAVVGPVMLGFPDNCPSS